MTDVSLWQTGLVSVFSAAIGGVIVHLSASRRDREIKRRDLVTKHLIELWQKIDLQNIIATQAVGAPEPDPKAWPDIVANIQLFGSDAQIQMMHKFVQEFHGQKISDTTDLLNDLRDSLRKELGLEKPQQPYFWFRIHKKISISPTENKK
jgi:hypothetical protein